MGIYQHNCVCSDVIGQLFINSKSSVIVDNLDKDVKRCYYDSNKVLQIQKNYRRHLASKNYIKQLVLSDQGNNKETGKHNTEIEQEVNEEINEITEVQFPTKGSKSKKDKKKKKKHKHKENDNNGNTNSIGGTNMNNTTNNNNNNNSQQLTPDNNDGGGSFTTPLPNPFDTSLLQGKIIHNFDTLPLNPKVSQTETTLQEFIIEEKELLRYFESYPYKLQQFQVEYPNNSYYNGYLSPTWSKEGFGIFIHEDGSKYEGMFKNDLAEGRGRLILSRGDYYEGEFSKDKANGYGKYVSDSGEIYIGYWNDDKQHGKGELLLKDGSRYEGDFKNGVKNGKGKISWPDTSFYKGDFVDNFYEGYGVYFMRNGKVFKGEWKKGQMEGIGIFVWPDGRKYIGHYHLDKRDGYGIYLGKNGNKYEGRFLKGKQHGIGKTTNENKEIQLGLYQKGKKIKCLNMKDFKEDIDMIDNEIKKINDRIDNVDFFKYDDSNKLNTGFTVDNNN